MKCRITGLAAALLLSTAAFAANAETITLQPDEDASKDVFVYAFSIPGTLGIPSAPNVSNLDTANIPASAAVPFGAFLGASETEPFRTNPDDPDEPLRAHTTRTLLQFDVSDVGIASSKVRSAHIDLAAVPGLPPFNNATPGTPVNLALKYVLEGWDEQLVTWETRPAVGDVVATASLTGAPQTARFDVTEALRKWLDDPASNMGVEISQTGLAAFPQVDGMRDRFAAALFASSGAADPAMRPSLTIEAVPLPAPFLLLLGGISALAGLGRARRRA